MSAKFYYYPQPTGNQLVTIDLGEDLAEMYSDWEYVADSSTTMTGRMQATTMLNREIVTIVRGRMQGGESMAHKFAALQNHLDRGFSVAFSASWQHSYSFPISTSPIGGDTVLQLFANPFYNMVKPSGSSAPIPEVNQYAVIETGPPGAVHEIIKIAAVSAGFSAQIPGGTVTAESPINFTYSKPAFLRWYRHFPVLKRMEKDRGKAIVTNEHGITWSLELRLTPDYSSLFGFHPYADSDVAPVDLPSLGEPGVVLEAGNVFESPPITLDNPPNISIGNGLENTFDTMQNTPWNNWRNWGN